MTAVSGWLPAGKSAASSQVRLAHTGWHRSELQRGDPTSPGLPRGPGSAPTKEPRSEPLLRHACPPPREHGGAELIRAPCARGGAQMGAEPAEIRPHEGGLISSHLRTRAA